MSSVNHILIEPLKIGTAQLQRRVVLAPLTLQGRHEPRPTSSSGVIILRPAGSRLGTLLITEATLVAARRRARARSGNLEPRSDCGVERAVHAKGSFIFSQLVALGRAANPPQLLEEDPYISDVQLTGKDTAPRPLIRSPSLRLNNTSKYLRRPRRTRLKLVCSFHLLIPGHRSDRFKYGGSIEYRAQFVLEVVDAVVAAVGAEKTAIRFSPWNHFQVVLTPSVWTWRCATPLPTFTYVVSQLTARHPDLAYLHLVDPRAVGNANREGPIGVHESNEPLLAPWAPRPLLRAGGLTRNDTLEASGKRALPDLPTRIERDIPFAPYDRSKFYLAGNTTPRGFTDFAAAV
ncbi:hypothetical protein B0H14DRAFT_3094668 [Mycena olivaceomarginata]|nr:hypothetical protein B0H14DRAFT_3094668 [Mycena olivaceomarginata]